MMITKLARTSITLFILLLLLTGCQPTVYLMPTPETLKDKRFDIFALNPNLEQNNQVNLFYATNRIPQDSSEDLRYGRKYDHSLRLGTAQLQIGSDDLTWDELYAQSTIEERVNKYRISLKETVEAGSIPEDAQDIALSPTLREFFDKLNQSIADSLVDELTIYVHGANNGFYRSAAQAAQYRHFTGKNITVLLFSWPSAENIFRYQTDVKQSMESAGDFSRLVKLLAKYSHARKINIIAYSAGARVVDPAMVILGVDYAKANREIVKKKLRLGELYYSAPDRELNAFVTGLPQYLDLFDRITLTAASNDSVLKYAKWTDGVQRVGSPPTDPEQIDLDDAQRDWISNVLSSGKLDLIDLGSSEIPGYKFSHSAWYENPWVSTDTIVTLNIGLPPEQRGLKADKTPRGGDVWYFPADYLEQLKKSLLERTKTEELRPLTP